MAAPNYKKNEQTTKTSTMHSNKVSTQTNGNQMYNQFNFTEEQQEAIRNFGALNYSAMKIISILAIPAEKIIEFKQSFSDTKGEVNQLIQQGKDGSEYIIDRKLLELAQNGDLKALETLEKRKKKQNNF